MSAANHESIYASTATELQNSSNWSYEARLFGEAVQNVKQRRSGSKFDVPFLEKFEAARLPEDFLEIFEECRDNNRALKAQSDSRKIDVLRRILDRFLAFRPFFDSAAKANQNIATPVWGVICAALTVVQSILKIGEKLDSISTRLEHCIKQYATLLQRGDDLDEQIKTSLIRFNELVVEFAFDIGSLLSKNRRKTWTSVANKRLPDELADLTQRLDVATQSVNSAVLISTNRDVTEIKRAQTFPLSPATQSNDTVATQPRTYRVPEMLSRHFTGRGQEMIDIQRIFDDGSDFGCRKCALVGIGGVGKSQLALQYIRSSLGNRYQRIFFARAESKIALQSELGLLSEQLGLCDSYLAQTQTARMVERLKNHLQNTDGWLFVFDNLKDSADVLPYLPSGGSGCIMFTTRNQIAAESLVARDNIVPIEPLCEENEGVELVFRLTATRNPTNALRQSALEIAKFARGLPLAIEQFVKFSLFSHTNWQNALQSVSTKFTLLEQQSFGSNHEQNLSVGAIVATSLAVLHTRDPKAASLFKLLVFLSQSSIPVTLLHNAKSNLEDYFKREHTFVRGQLRTNDDLARIAREAEATSRGFSLWDYDPFKPDLYKKILRLGNYQPRYQNTTLPRVDSEHDIELRDHWSSEKHTLQAVLDSNLTVDDALIQLESLGLIRRLDERQNVWIHDLFVEVAQAITESESVQVHRSLAHTAATMVFLAFPIPIYPHNRSSELLLPHAVSTHSHLQATGILSSTTVGPELSHLIGSTIYTLGSPGWRRTETEQQVRMGQVCHYFKCASEGYRAAWKRLSAAKDVTDERIVLSTFADFSREDMVSVYSPDRHLRSYERFGRSAPWRCIQTMTKYSDMLTENEQLDQALLYLSAAVQMAEVIFGHDSVETMPLLDRLCSLRCQRKEWNEAYIIARRQAEGFMGFKMDFKIGPSKTTDLDLQRQALCPSGYSYHELQSKMSSDMTKRAKTVSAIKVRNHSKSKTSSTRMLPGSFFRDPAKALSLSRFRSGSKQQSRLPLFLNTPMGLVDTEDGAALAGSLGYITARIEGKEKESLFWYKVGLQAVEYSRGQYTAPTVHAMSNLSFAHMRVAKASVATTETNETEPVEEIVAASDLKASFFWALKAVEVALQGSNAGISESERAPTIQDRLEAGELPLEWVTFEPQSEEEQERLDGNLRFLLKDPYPEEMIQNLEEVRASVPDRVLDRDLSLLASEVEENINEWRTKQEHWQTRSYIVPPGSLQVDSAGISQTIDIRSPPKVTKTFAL